MQNKKAYELVTTGSPKHSGIPCAMVLTVSSALSLATGLSCHHRSQSSRRVGPKGRHRFCELDPSVGGSGPHGFAVRVRTVRPRVRYCTSRPVLPRPSHPALNVHDDREAPLSRAQDGALLK
jgi:hypothetical protein